MDTTNVDRRRHVAGNALNLGNQMPRVAISPRERTVPSICFESSGGLGRGPNRLGCGNERERRQDRSLDGPVQSHEERR